MGTKVSDLLVAAGCMHCHALLDRVDRRIFLIEEQYPAALQAQIMGGLAETLSRWVMMEKIIIPNSKIK